MSQRAAEWASGYSLIRPARIAGVTRACSELGEPELAFGASQLCLLVCAIDDVVDDAGIALSARDALLRALVACGDPADIVPDVARHAAALRAMAERSGPAFTHDLASMFTAMRHELSGRVPDLQAYLEVGAESIAAPAVFSWVAAFLGVEPCRALSRHAGVALRLANDLADAGREAQEGKINALAFAPAERLKELALDGLRSAHAEARALDAERAPWAQAVLRFTDFVFSGYAKNGDLILTSSIRDSAAPDRASRTT